MAELLGLGTVFEAGRIGEAGAARGRADGAVEPRSAEAMEEAPVHAGALQVTHRAAVAVGQDGFGAEFGGDGLQARGDFVESFVPRDARKAAFAFRADAALRVEQAAGRVLALEIAGDFSAQESAGDGMIGIAAQAAAAAVFDVDQQTASVGAIERADGMANFGGQVEIIAA